MTRNRRQWIPRLRGAATMALALVLAACGSGSNNSGQPSASATEDSLSGQTVRIVSGGGSDFSDGSLYRAFQVMQDEGIDVQHSVVEDPQTALRSVIAGQNDIALLNPLEGLKAVINAGSPVKYIASTLQTTDYEIVALPNISLSNLDGATFATAGPGTAGDLIATSALAKLGVDTSKLHKVTVGGTSARTTAILAGQVDLAPLLAPSAVAAVATGKVKILVNAGKVLSSYLQQGLIANTAFTANTTLAQAVVNAFIDGARWASTNESGYLSLAQDENLMGDLTDSDAKSSYQQLVDAGVFATNGAICEDAVNQTLQYAYDTPDSGLTEANTPAYTDWVDSSFVQAYLESNNPDQNSLCAS